MYKKKSFSAVAMALGGKFNMAAKTQHEHFYAKPFYSIPLNDESMRADVFISIDFRTESSGVFSRSSLPGRLIGKRQYCSLFLVIYF